MSNKPSLLSAMVWKCLAVYQEPFLSRLRNAYIEKRWVQELKDRCPEFRAHWIFVTSLSPTSVYFHLVIGGKLATAKYQTKILALRGLADVPNCSCTVKLSLFFARFLDFSLFLLDISWSQCVKYSDMNLSETCSLLQIQLMYRS